MQIKWYINKKKLDKLIRKKHISNKYFIKTINRI